MQRSGAKHLDKEESVEGRCSHYIIIVSSEVYMLTDVDLAERLSHERKVPGSNSLPIEIVLNAYGVIALYSCGHITAIIGAFLPFF